MIPQHYYIIISEKQNYDPKFKGTTRRKKRVYGETFRTYESAEKFLQNYQYSDINYTNYQIVEISI